MFTPQKVLMVIENCPVPGDTRVWAEATALSERGFAVSIIGPGGTTDDFQPYICLEGIHIYRYHLPSTTNLWLSYLLEYSLSTLKTWWLSLLVLHKHGFDVIHAGNPPDLFFFLHWFYILLGKRFIFDQHDLAPEIFQVKFGGQKGFLHRILLWLETRSYRAASIVLTTNESQRQVAITRGKCNPAKVFVVRNGPELDRLQRVPAELELKRGRASLLVYLGSMEIQDGIDYALRALHELIYTLGYHSVSLALLGDGGHQPALKELAHELGLEEHVHFTGWVDEQEIMRYLSTADIGLCPDPLNGLNEHCTMIKSMEYMAMGLPVVAFDLKETRYTTREAALYATPNSVPEFARQIAHLLDDAQLRHLMGQRARELVEERLSWDHEKQHLWYAYSMLSCAFARESRVERTKHPSSLETKPF